MFDHIVLRRAEGGSPVSVGQIAEALLYYQRVHLFIDRGTLATLIRQIGAESLLILLGRRELSAVYSEEILATKTESFGVSKAHRYVALSFAGHESVGELKNPVDRLQYDLEQFGIAKHDATRFVKRFLSLVPVRKFSGNYFFEGGITAAAEQDLLDSEYARQAIRNVVPINANGYEVTDDLKFEVIKTELGIFVFTDLDLDAINARRRQLSPIAEPLTIAHFLSNILDARADLALAAHYGGDFVTSAAASSIIQTRHSELLRRTGLNIESRHQFLEIVLPDSPSVAEVIDAGERTLDEFFVMLDRAARFKDWLKGVNPDEDLVRTYLRDVCSEDRINSFPAKTLRYLITVAAEMIHPTVGVVSSFADNFLVEKLLSGWRPNHFVSERLSRFVQEH